MAAQSLRLKVLGCGVAMRRLYRALRDHGLTARDASLICWGYQRATEDIADGIVERWGGAAIVERDRRNDGEAE